MTELRGNPTAPVSLPDALIGLIDPVERVIAPAKRRIRPGDLVRQWPIIRVIAARDFKVKYKQSLLGPVWLVFQPLALLLAFLVAFRGLGNVRSAGVPYTVFALIGLSAWSYVQASLTIGTASLVSNMPFVKYTPCPRTAFPVAAMLASLPSFGITALAGVIGAAATGHLSPRVLLLPLGLTWLVVLTAGMIGVSSSLAVRFRDVNSALPFLLQLGTFLAPVGYPLTGLSPKLRAVIEINPITGIIETLRWMVLGGYRPAGLSILISAVLTSLLATVGWRMFARRETTVADEI
jgi:ABC-type polysaccharide/polyol phosphate export permease